MWGSLNIFTDIDECTANTHDCDSSATCTNTECSFYCTCNEGYTGDGRSCIGELQVHQSLLILPRIHWYSYDCTNSEVALACMNSIPPYSSSWENLVMSSPYDWTSVRPYRLWERGGSLEVTLTGEHKNATFSWRDWRKENSFLFRPIYHVNKR